jgi:methionyl-tRNA formyltransferase
MRVLFIGTGDIGLPSLDWLLAEPGHEVVAVVTQPDKPVGRKQVLTPPQIKTRALAAAVPVLQPPGIRHAVGALRAFDADIAIVVAYGQILPSTVLDLPRHGCLNIHASILPKYRGAAPIQAAIREGDVETGITIMFMDEGLDTGDILLIERTPILREDTGGSLHDRLAIIAPGALKKALNLIADGKAPRTPQDHSVATHVGKLTREHGRVDWSRSAEQIERTIRAYQPWPGSFCLLPGEGEKAAMLKIHAAKKIEAAEACPAPGTLIAADSQNGLLIATGSGLIALEQVQVEGGKRMDARSFLRGHSLEAGAALS